MNFLKAHFEKIAFTILILWIASSAITTMSSNTNASQATRDLRSRKDSDREGMEDAWEIKHGLNHLKNDADLDPDQDGFTNLEEYGKNRSMRSSPHDPKSSPPLAVKLHFIKTIKRPLAFRFLKLNITNPNIKETWSLQLQAKDKHIKRIGDKLSKDCKILDIKLNKKEPQKSIIVLSSKKHGPFEAYINRNVQLPPLVHFNYYNQRIITQYIKGRKNNLTLINPKNKDSETYSIHTIILDTLILLDDKGREIFIPQKGPQL